MNQSWGGVEGLLLPLGLGFAQQYSQPGCPPTAATRLGDLALHIAKTLSQQRVEAP